MSNLPENPDYNKIRKKFARPVNESFQLEMPKFYVSHFTKTGEKLTKFNSFDINLVNAGIMIVWNESRTAPMMGLPKSITIEPVDGFILSVNYYYETVSVNHPSSIVYNANGSDVTTYKWRFYGRQFYCYGEPMDWDIILEIAKVIRYRVVRDGYEGDNDYLRETYDNHFARMRERGWLNKKDYEHLPQFYQDMDLYFNEDE